LQQQQQQQQLLLLLLLLLLPPSQQYAGVKFTKQRDTHRRSVRHAVPEKIPERRKQVISSNGSSSFAI
jgi:hypothetical protein